MNINFNKLIGELLPVSLRNSRRTALLQVLLSGIVYLHNWFRIFAREQSYKINANGSVISLEHHIAREFDVNCSISELDGFPFDFLVTVNGSVDEQRLKALIDQYKLAGKSYTFALDSQYSVEFIDYVCEKMSYAFSAEFINHICERKHDINITLYMQLQWDPYLGAAVFGLHISASEPLKNEVSLSLQINYYHVIDGNAYMEGQSENILLPVDSTELYFSFPVMTGNDGTVQNYSLAILSHGITGGDNYYNYNLVII